MTVYSHYEFHDPLYPTQSKLSHLHEVTHVFNFHLRWFTVWYIFQMSFLNSLLLHLFLHEITLPHLICTQAVCTLMRQIWFLSQSYQFSHHAWRNLVHSSSLHVLSCKLGQSRQATVVLGVLNQSDSMEYEKEDSEEYQETEELKAKLQMHKNKN